MKKISNIFIALAVILSNVMCAVVAYNYCAMQWGAKYAVYVKIISYKLYFFLPIFCNQLFLTLSTL